jgi:16S rRNA (adenine1518-N6/adenine1519-N6)-dimethyltransferase
VNLSELLLFLQRIGRRPNRGLSQNFLIDQNVSSKIVRTAAIAPGDNVLEIGPGPGALTSSLLDAGANVFAIEKDPVLAKELLRFQTQDKRLSAISADFLDVSLRELPAPLKVVANLPYHITTPILEKLIESRHLFSTLTIMVQSELADRIAASAGSKDFSSLSLFLQFHTTHISSFKVAAPCFYPKPNVDSKVLHLALRPPPLQESEPFFDLVRCAFQKRRKMLRVSLRPFYPSEVLELALLAAKANRRARPEALTLDQWLLFYQALERHGAAESTKRS